jgi:hypothetical protein
VRRPIASPPKDATYRARLRAEAITALGGCCVECGFTGSPHAFDITYDPPLERGLNGAGKNHGLGSRLHRRIIAGDRSGIRLLCCNCRCIRTRSNGAIHRNVMPKAAGLPATPAARAMGRDRR